MKNALAVLTLCSIGSLILRAVESGTLGREEDQENAGLSRSLTKRNPDIDPINQDVHVLWDEEDPVGAFDPDPNIAIIVDTALRAIQIHLDTISPSEEHGVYVLFDKDDLSDVRSKRSLYNIVHSLKSQHKKARGRRSLYNIVKNVRKNNRRKMKKRRKNEKKTDPDEMIPAEARLISTGSNTVEKKKEEEEARDETPTEVGYGDDSEGGSDDSEDGSDDGSDVQEGESSAEDGESL